MTAISSFEYQKDLLAYYLAALRYGGNAELLDFQFASSEALRAATVRVARLQLPCDDSGSLMFAGTLGHNEAYSLAIDHAHQFIGIFDSVDLGLCEMVASTYHFDRFVETLGYGHTFPLGRDSLLRSRGYSAGLTLGADLYMHFDANECLAAGVSTRLFAVVPITDPELQIKKDAGLDALVAAWTAQSKDFLHVSV